MAEDYAVIGKRADGLRAELRKLEARLEAAHFYWKNHGRGLSDVQKAQS
jgi:hypothetical protein